MHTRYSEISLPHFLSEPIHLLLRIAENNSLCNRKSIIQLLSVSSMVRGLHHTKYQISNLPFQQQ